MTWPELLGHRLKTKNLDENFNCDVGICHFTVTAKALSEMLGHKIKTKRFMRIVVVGYVEDMLR